MYTSYFGLSEKPFAITPDPRYLYLSERHAEALAHLLYGIDDAGGFVQLTGEVGTGKTTTVRGLLAELPAHADVALILNPRVTPLEFLVGVCDELKITLTEPQRLSIKDIVDVLNHFLLAAHTRGRRVVLIVDEAQQLSADVLEQVRLLTNLETATRKLLQIILVGQPELRDVLARNDLRQLAQRITGRYHLDPLTAPETAEYIRHRLKVAGSTADIFTPRALEQTHRLSGGIPRLINVIADRALLGAFTRESRDVTPSLVREAAQEVSGDGWRARHRYRWLVAALALVVVSATGYVWRRAVQPPAAVPVLTAAPMATPAAAVHPAPLADALRALAADTGTDAAFATLFEAWGTALDRAPAAAQPCTQAEAAGLECHAEKGSLAELHQFNRPAIVTLALDDGSSHQVVLRSIDWQRHVAHLLVGSVALDVDLLELESHWFGDYLLLWRPPTTPSALIRPGSHGPEVEWLRTRLPGGLSGTGSPDQYDSPLAHAISEFQRAHHLASDGLAGLRTQLVLDGDYAGAEGPRLNEEIR